MHRLNVDGPSKTKPYSTERKVLLHWMSHVSFHVLLYTRMRKITHVFSFDKLWNYFAIGKKKHIYGFLKLWWIINVISWSLYKLFYFQSTCNRWVNSINLQAHSDVTFNRLSREYCMLQMGVGWWRCGCFCFKFHTILYFLINVLDESPEMYWLNRHQVTIWSGSN